jgi:hypothetical protein
MKIVLVAAFLFFLSADVCLSDRDYGGQLPDSFPEIEGGDASGDTLWEGSSMEEGAGMPTMDLMTTPEYLNNWQTEEGLSRTMAPETVTKRTRTKNWHPIPAQKEYTEEVESDLEIDVSDNVEDFEATTAMLSPIKPKTRFSNQHYGKFKDEQLTKPKLVAHKTRIGKQKPLSEGYGSFVPSVELPETTDIPKKTRLGKRKPIGEGYGHFLPTEEFPKVEFKPKNTRFEQPKPAFQGYGKTRIAQLKPVLKGYGKMLSSEELQDLEVMTTKKTRAAKPKPGHYGKLFDDIDNSNSFLTTELPEFETVTKNTRVVKPIAPHSSNYGKEQLSLDTSGD